MNSIKIRIFSYFFLIGFTTCGISQHRVDRNRIAVTLEFVKALQGSLSNEEIVKKYMETDYYFKVDSVKKLADEFLSPLRSAIKDYKVRTVKYMDIENEFDVEGVNPIDGPFLEKRKLNFFMGDRTGKYHQVAKEDLYIIKITLKDGTERVRGIPILFEGDRIISFACWTTGTDCVMLKF